MQRCLYPLFQNQSPHFLLSSLFWKLSQPLGQDQQNSKQIYCQLPIIIFLWTPKGFISPESFLNFLLNLYIPPWLQKSFKFIVLTYCKYICESKNWICSFLLMPPSKTLPQVFIIIPRQRGIAHSSRTAFSENILSWSERGGKGLWMKKLPKSTMVLVTSFDKFHHLCNL